MAEEGAEDPQEAAKSVASLERHGYTTGKVLGSGSYSTVRLVIKDGVTYACKIVSKELTSPIYRVKFLPRELKILGSMKHPHIARVFTIIEEPEKVFVIMELATGGDLLEKIQKVRRLDERNAHTFFMQLASALAYLHKNDVAHRDLKCENVLLSAMDVVKLTDFSFSRFCTDPATKQKDLSSTFCGSEAYAAPEILQGIRYLPKLEDMWSLGVILYVMVTGLLPFEGGSLLRQLRLQMTRSVRFPKPLAISHQLKNLIRSMLEPVIMLRANMARVLRHPWIKMYPSPFKEIHQRVAEYERQQALARKSAPPPPPAPMALVPIPDIPELSAPPPPAAAPPAAAPPAAAPPAAAPPAAASPAAASPAAAPPPPEPVALDSSGSNTPQPPEPAAPIAGAPDAPLEGAALEGEKSKGESLEGTREDSRKTSTKASPEVAKEEDKSGSTSGSSGGGSDISNISNRSVKKIPAKEHIPKVPKKKSHMKVLEQEKKGGSPKDGPKDPSVSSTSTTISGTKDSSIQSQEKDAAPPERPPDQQKGQSPQAKT